MRQSFQKLLFHGPEQDRPSNVKALDYDEHRQTTHHSRILQFDSILASYTLCSMISRVPASLLENSLVRDRTNTGAHRRSGNSESSAGAPSASQQAFEPRNWAFERLSIGEGEGAAADELDADQNKRHVDMEGHLVEGCYEVINCSILDYTCTSCGGIGKDVLLEIVTGGA
ncbi:hypothetical protein SUNI508_05668 [Seiridium unicorne]|uniref:Uncharacterized protein n=1 Tax=Seiridium unicorne TaxID=138068 RepID=A0ABR2V3E4_9PEZI